MSWTLATALLLGAAASAAGEAPDADPSRVAMASPARDSPLAAPATPPGAPATARDRPRAARATRLGVVLELRSEFGFRRTAALDYSNERRASLDLNDGLGVSVGASALPLARGRLATRATVGVKVARLAASNGSALFLAFPVDVMEVVYLGPVRLGAGASVLLAPRVRGDGILESSGVTFGTAPGALADVEWIVSARTRTGVGVRASWYLFAPRGPGTTAREGVPAVGLIMRSDFDLSGR